ncbi:hypothetical protein SMICM17S_00028 [Streptomyces microflavus]
MVRMLCSRSASLMTRTRGSLAMATTILRTVSACAASPNLTLSSLVTPSTRRATWSPNSRLRVSRPYSVSSTVSCSRPAIRVAGSIPSSARIVVTASGCVMYGSPLFCASGRGASARPPGRRARSGAAWPSRSWGRCPLLTQQGFENRVVRAGKRRTPSRARRARTRLEEPPERGAAPAGTAGFTGAGGVGAGLRRRRGGRFRGGLGRLRGLGGRARGRGRFRLPGGGRGGLGARKPASGSGVGFGAFEGAAFPGVAGAATGLSGCGAAADWASSGKSAPRAGSGVPGEPMVTIPRQVLARGR